MLGNRWLWVLIATTVLGALWITFNTGIALHHYYVLSAHAPAQDLVWTIVPRDSEHYLFRATYTYTNRGATYTGTTTLPSPVYRNRWSAEQDLPKIERERHDAWYNPEHPASSSLYRTFPLKETMYGAVIWGVVAYFTGLAWYVGRR